MTSNCFVLFAVFFSAFFAQAQPSSTHSNAAVATAPSNALRDQMLSWLPADTETVMGVSGPLLMPTTIQAPDGTMTIEKSGDEVRDVLKQYSLLQLLTLSKSFKGKPIAMAMEGSRNFRQPSGLGMALYQGGSIAVFVDDITASADAFLKDSASTIVKIEQIEGQNVAVFKQKSEEDIWTTYVAFPRSNMAVIATDEDYLREVLSRINGKKGERAFPDRLPEWKYLNTQAQFWAMRHFRKDDAKPSLTSGFSCITPGMKPDKQAIGLTFSFDPDKSKIATITYLSEDENTLQTIQRNLFNEREQVVTAMHAHYRELSHETLEGSYSLEQADSASYFMFLLADLLGHAIFV